MQTAAVAVLCSGASAQAVWCNGVRYWGACPTPAPAVDPNEATAWALNTRGNTAFNAGRFAEAAQAYEQALQHFEHPSIRQNYRNARINDLEQQAKIQWENRNWNVVIALYEQARHIEDQAWMHENINKARGHVYADQASKLFDAKDYNQAALFWDEAYRIDPHPSYAENARIARARRMSDRVSSAYNAANYADAIDAAKELLRAEPKSRWAVEMLAYATLELVKQRPSGSVEQARALLDQAMNAYLAAVRAHPGDVDLRGKFETARTRSLHALFDAARKTRSPGGWDVAIESYVGWGGNRETAMSWLKRSTGGEVLGMGTWAPAVSVNGEPLSSTADGAVGTSRPAPAAFGPTTAELPNRFGNISPSRRDELLAIATGRAGGSSEAEQAAQARDTFNSTDPKFHFEKSGGSIAALDKQISGLEDELSKLPAPSQISDPWKRKPVETRRQELTQEITELKKKRTYYLKP